MADTEVAETEEVEETYEEEIIEETEETEEEEEEARGGKSSKKKTTKKTITTTKKKTPKSKKKKKVSASHGGGKKTKGKGKGKGKGKKGSIVWGRKPLSKIPSFTPCPHIYFKEKVEDRSKLKKNDYINLLATPRREPWVDMMRCDPELVPYRRRAMTARTTCLAIPKKMYVKAILEEFFEILTDNQKDNLKEILQTECDFTKENPQEKSDSEDKPGSASKKKSESQGTGVPAKTQRPKSATSNKQKIGSKEGKSGPEKERPKSAESKTAKEPETKELVENNEIQMSDKENEDLKLTDEVQPGDVYNADEQITEAYAENISSDVEKTGGENEIQQSADDAGAVLEEASKQNELPEQGNVEPEEEFQDARSSNEKLDNEATG